MRWGPCGSCHPDPDGSSQVDGHLRTAFGQTQHHGSGSCDALVLVPGGCGGGSDTAVAVVVLAVGAAWCPDGSVDVDWHWRRTDGACDCCCVFVFWTWLCFFKTFTSKSILLFFFFWRLIVRTEQSRTNNEGGRDGSVVWEGYTTKRGKGC